MSGQGLGIPYGDRPIANVNPSGGAFATTEFLQFLERLSRATGAISGGGATLAAQVAAHTSEIATISGQIVTIASEIATIGSIDVTQSGQINAIQARVPSPSSVVAGSAIALASGTAAVITSQPVGPGLALLVGMVCLTGTGTVTLAQASTGLTAAVIETAPGAFATGWFGGGVAPATLGVDLTIGSFVQLITGASATVYLNARATFTGTVSGYGSLLVWPLGG